MDKIIGGIGGGLVGFTAASTSSLADHLTAVVVALIGAGAIVGGQVMQSRRNARQLDELQTLARRQSATEETVLEMAEAIEESKEEA